MSAEHKPTECKHRERTMRGVCVECGQRSAKHDLGPALGGARSPFRGLIR